MEEPLLARSVKRPKQRSAIDDAGAPIRGIDFTDLPIAEGEAGRPMRRFVKQLRTAARHEGSLSNRGQLIVLVLTIAVLLGWGALNTRVQLPRLMSLPAFFGVLGLGVGLSWLVTRRVGLRVQRGGIARAIAARGYCGGCGYDLRGPAGQRPRFVECPECAARWSPDRLMSAPLESKAWDTLGKGAGRVPVSRLLAADDRGMLIRRIRSVHWRAPKAGRRLWTDEQRRGMKRARRRTGFKWRLLASFAGLAAVAIFALPVFAGPNDLTASTYVLLGSLFAALGAVVAASTWIGEFGVSNRRFVSAVREAGVCAGCAASIKDTPIDGDGFRVCSSCGSSWNATTLAELDE